MLALICGHFSRCVKDQLSTGARAKARGVRQSASKGGLVDMEAEQVIADGPDSGSAPGRAGRQFDFRKFNKRHVALKLAYLGWDYHGLAIQETTENTIEAKLFECLQKTKLIEDWRTCGYSRCGRTDKGVSALCQVVSLKLRSNLLDGEGIIVSPDSTAHERKGDKTKELPYLTILNRNLPPVIQAVAWAPVGPDFSARFSCLQRTYKYFFPQGTMDIEVMRGAAQRFLGEHDFRNFCKMDLGGGVTNFRRRILGFNISPLTAGSPSPYQMHEVTITGTAFLWHQVRCMVAILFLVGHGLESPDLITHMLDIEKCPRKPQYGMASEIPLVLYDCVYEGLQWQGEERMNVVSHFQNLWTTQMVRATMVRRMLDSLELPTSPSSPLPPQAQMAPIIQADHRLGRANYKPLLTRPTASTFEERYEQHRSKRRKMEDSEKSVSPSGRT